MQRFYVQVELPVKMSLVTNNVLIYQHDGSACGPVIVPVFKTGGWQVILSLVGSTPTRFRHLKPASLLKIYTSVPLNVRDTVLASRHG